MIVGRFEVEREAGAGGMGTVYRARDRETGEIVALKILRDIDPSNLDRFEREARALAELRHPAIVRYIDHGTAAAGAPYLAMEWLQGEDLGERLARSGLTLAEAVTLGRSVAEALAAIHARGVVHRDLKPSNLFLRAGDIEQVKIIDFGIARLGFATRGVTRTGMGMGTPGYMAPEQASGARDVDGRADVFSLGCVLFECLTGRPAFAGEHAMAILTKLLFEEAPRVSEVCPDAPLPLSALVDQMLSKDPSKRPATAALVAEELSTIQSLTGPERNPGEAARRKATPRATLGGTPDAKSGESRIVSVLLIAAQPRCGEPSPRSAHVNTDETLPAEPPDVPDGSDDVLRAVASEHAGQCARLLDGTRAVVITGAGAATDRAVLAARCALAIRLKILEPRIALATGRGSMSGSGPVGETIDRAAKLLLTMGDVSPPSPIQIDELTAGLLEDRFDVRADAGGLFLCEEREPGEAPRTLLGKPTTCFGRDRELRLLEELLEECISEPAARAVLITADAGMGKSRVYRELARRLRGRGEAVEIWTARGDPMRVGAPFGMLGQLIRAAVGLRGGEPLAARRSALEAGVGRFVAENQRRVAEFLGEIIGAPFPGEDSVELRAARQDPILMSDQTRRAWVELAEAACGIRPVVLVLEDLHWGDPPTVEHLDAALRLLRAKPLMVLALARPDVHDRFPKLWAMRDVQEIRLAGLSRKACASLVREALGREVSEERVEELCERSAGNAFFLEELVRAEAEGKGGDAPPTVVAMLQSRLEALEDGERRALRVGSLFGGAFWRGAVSELSGATSSELGEALRGLEEKELVLRRSSARFQGEVEYSFRHALVREAAYGTLTDEERALGHRLAGAWLERAGELDAAVLAEHFERGRDRDRAASWFCRAAELSLEANDFTGSIERARRCEDCGAAGVLLCKARITRSQAHHWLGDADEAEVWAAAAMAVSPKGGAQWYEALIELLNVAADRGDHDRIVELAEMIGEPATEPDAIRARVIARARVAGALLFVRAYERGEALVRELELERDGLADEASIRAHLLFMRFMHALHRGNMDDALGILEQDIECFRILGNTRTVYGQTINLGALHTRLGAYAEAVSVIRAALSDAERIGLRTVVPSAKACVSARLQKPGSWRLTRSRALKPWAIGDLLLWRAAISRGYLSSRATRRPLSRRRVARSTALGAFHPRKASPWPCSQARSWQRGARARRFQPRGGLSRS